MRRRYWIMLGVIVVAVAAVGSAVAATKLESPGAQSQAIIKDAAGRLHVTAGALSSALKQALDDQVDASVAAGRLTKQEGAALKARIAKGQTPLVRGAGNGFGGQGFGFGHRGGGRFGADRAGGMFGADFKTVVSYLGITQAQLQTALESGKSLAQIATAHGKTADGLVAALVAAAKTKLDQAVTAKHITSVQEKAILNRLPSTIKSLVNGTHTFGKQSHHGFDFGFGSHAHGQGAPPSGTSSSWPSSRPSTA